MLCEVQIKNFKSIADLTLNLSYQQGKKQAGNIISYLRPFSAAKLKESVVPVMNIFGANASGKSNIIEAIFTLKQIVSRGNNVNLYKPNKLKELGKNIEIKLVFFFNRDKYTYSLSFNSKSIVREILYVKNKVLFKIENKKTDFTNISTKVNTNKYLNELYKESCLESDFDREDFNQKHTFINKVVKRLPSLNIKLINTLRFITEKLFILRGNSRIPESFAIDILSHDDDIEKSFERISSLVKKLDIDINRFEFKRNDMGVNTNGAGLRVDFNNKQITQDEILSYHTAENGEDVPLDFYTEESVGTRKIFGLLGFILTVLDKGGVLIVDELDASIHPLVLLYLIKIFKDPDYNKKNAQIISTIHSTDILEQDIFTLSEFAFINKTKKLGSYIVRLSELEQRNDVNFRDRYVNGQYLGISYPYI